MEPEYARPASSPKHQRLVAAVIVAALASWWIPSTMGTEVYPSVSLPSFGPVPDPGSRVDYLFEATTDGRTRALDTAAVYDGIRSSAWPNVTEALATHAKTDAVAEWLTARAETVVGACVDTIELVRVEGDRRRVLAASSGACAP